MFNNKQNSVNKKIKLAPTPVMDNDGMKIEELMERFGFNLINKNVRVVCLKNAPNTVEELQNANNLKASLPEFVQKKITPALKNDAETPKNLLVTFKDVIKNEEPEELESENNTPIIEENPIVLIDSSDEQQTEEQQKETVKNHLKKAKQSKTSTTKVVNPLALMMQKKTTENQQKTVPVASSSFTLPIKSSRGPTYSGREELAIIRYILDNNYESAVKGANLWIQMEDSGVCATNQRTWQSMKNRFKRSILPNLRRPEFKLTQEEIQRIRNPKYNYYSHASVQLKTNGLRKRQYTSKKTKDDDDGFYNMNIRSSDSSDSDT